MSWQDRAACVGYPAVWWDDDTRHGVTEEQVRAAGICRTCPVMLECLTEDRDVPHADRGYIRGGYFVGRKNSPRVPSVLPVYVPLQAGPGIQPCGTPAAWERHRKRGEVPCGPCIAARAGYDAAAYQARVRTDGPLPECACGCGLPTGRSGNRFRNGHNFRGASRLP